MPTVTHIHGLNEELQFLSSDRLTIALRSLRQACPQIRYLNLMECNLREDHLQELTQFPALRRLNLTFYNELTMQGVQYLAQLKNLSHLDLSCSSITDEGMHFIAEHTDLNILNLHLCEEITPKAIADLQAAMPHLRITGIGI